MQCQPCIRGTAQVLFNLPTVLAESPRGEPRPGAVHAGHGAVVERPQRWQRVRGGVEPRLRGPRGVAERRPRGQAGREPLYRRLRVASLVLQPEAPSLGQEGVRFLPLTQSRNFRCSSGMGLCWVDGG